MARSHKKRGQLTAFMLVSFVVVIMVVLMVIMYISLAGVSISNKQFALKKVNEVKQYINDCITTGLVEGLRKVGIAGIKDHMRSINCEGFGGISGIRSVSERPEIETRINEKNIEVDADFGIVVGDDKASIAIRKQSYSYDLYEERVIDSDDDGIVDYDERIDSLGNVGMLILQKGTMVSNPRISLGIEKGNEIGQLSGIVVAEPYGEFVPSAMIAIIYDKCDESKIAIIDKETYEAHKVSCLTFFGKHTYAAAEITKASSYFVGSCDDYECDWVTSRLNEADGSEETGIQQQNSGQDVIGNEPAENLIEQPENENEIDCTDSNILNPKCQ